MDDGPDYYRPPPKSPIPAAVVASIVTTLVSFFALRALEDRGAFTPAPKRGPVPATGAVTVPSVLGMMPEQARELLKARDLLLAFSAERESAQYRPGTIAEQSPLPESQLPRGGVVQAGLARGLKQVRVPGLVGMRAEEALKQLMAVGLTAGPEKTTITDAAPPGTVVGTEPAAGAPVAARGSVVLVLSTGAPTRTIPKVTGMRLRAARELLEQQGWKVGKIRYDSDADRAGGVILEQRPPAAGSAPPGATTIDLTINEE